MRRDVRGCSPFFATYTRFLVTVAMATREEAASKNKEGTNLLGAPTFAELENGRFKCVETGHELLAKDKESYAHSKRCRLVLIDFFLSRNKPPLNMFKQDPLSRYPKFRSFSLYRQFRGFSFIIILGSHLVDELMLATIGLAFRTPK